MSAAQRVKPVYLDYRSLPLVNLVARMIRNRAGGGDGGPATVTFTELLPDLDQLWLPDADGHRYTAETPDRRQPAAHLDRVTHRVQRCPALFSVVQGRCCTAGSDGRVKLSPSLLV